MVKTIGRAKIFEKYQNKWIAFTDDDKFIACALAAKSNVIVTGDDDLLSIDGYMNLSMIKPRAFLNNFLN